MEYVDCEKPRGCMFIREISDFKQNDDLGFKIVCKWFSNTSETTEYFFRALSKVDKDDALDAFGKGQRAFQSLRQQAGGEGFNEEMLMGLVLGRHAKYESSVLR